MTHPFANKIVFTAVMEFSIQQRCAGLLNQIVTTDLRIPKFSAGFNMKKYNFSIIAFPKTMLFVNSLKP